MTSMRERIANALEAKVLDLETADPTLNVYRQIGKPEYALMADAAMAVYGEVTRDHQFPDDVRNTAIRVMMENTLPFMSDYMCAAILADRETR